MSATFQLNVKPTRTTQHSPYFQLCHQDGDHLWTMQHILWYSVSPCSSLVTIYTVHELEPKWLKTETAQWSYAKLQIQSFQGWLLNVSRLLCLFLRAFFASIIFQHFFCLIINLPVYFFHSNYYDSPCTEDGIKLINAFVFQLLAHHRRGTTETNVIS